MTDEIRALVSLCAALAARNASRIDDALDGAATMDPAAVEEAILQSYLFLGYPAALNAMARWRERTGRAAPPAAPDDWDGWRVRGEAVCARVYAGQYPRLRENVARMHPDLERWMITEGYGKVLGRRGLDLGVRELCIVALLVAQDAVPQLHAHLRGALNVGAAPEEVEAALDIACAGLPPARRSAALSVWSAVRERWRSRPVEEAEA